MHECRSLRPAQDAASVLHRYKQDNPTSRLDADPAEEEEDAQQTSGVCVVMSIASAQVMFEQNSYGQSENYHCNQQHTVQSAKLRP